MSLQDQLPAASRKMSFKALVIALFLVTTFILSTVAVLVYHNFKSISSDIAAMFSAYEELGLIREVDAKLIELESIQQAYVLTGDESYLDAYRNTSLALKQKIFRLKIAADGKSSSGIIVSEMDSLLRKRVDLADAILKTDRSKGDKSAHERSGAGRGRSMTELLRRQFEDLTSLKMQQLKTSHDAAQEDTKQALVFGSGGLLVCYAIMLLTFWLIRRESNQRHQTESSLQDANDKLQRYITEMQRMTHHTRLMTVMSDFLQSCRTPMEAYNLISQHLSKLLPEISGCIGIINNSHRLVETVVKWGENSAVTPTFTPDDCWALRRGRMHRVEESGPEPKCEHYGNSLPTASICVPMVAHGETLGVLCLSAKEASIISEERQEQARSVAEQVSLALANLRLQESLRSQSVRDPLTGLYNRRYLEESLEREVARAKRHVHPLSIMMLDLDHFKRFNDSYGHEAGDVLLGEFGAFLSRAIRHEDIACRYGGEEFTLVLPDADLTVAKKRAEFIRSQTQKLMIQYRRQTLEPVTISIGLAVFPENGDEGEVLIRSADAALYRAKHTGRDRVVSAHEVLNLKQPSGTQKPKEETVSN